MVPFPFDRDLTTSQSKTLGNSGEELKIEYEGRLKALDSSDNDKKAFEFRAYRLRSFQKNNQYLLRKLKSIDH